MKTFTPRRESVCSLAADTSLAMVWAIVLAACCFAATCAAPAGAQSLDAALEARVVEVVGAERARADARHAETLERIEGLEQRVEVMSAGAVPTPVPVAAPAVLETLEITQGGTPGNPRVYDGDDFGPVRNISAKSVSHIVIRDFDLVRPAGGGQTAGIIVLGNWQGVSIIDCTVRGYDDGMNIQGSAGLGIVARDLVIDGCVIRDSRQVGPTHSQGIYLDSIDGVRITNTVLHGNGKPDSPFDHNLYAQFNVSGMVFAGNSTTLAAATGAMIRGGGDITDNIVAANPIGLIGGINETKITGNFVLGGAGFDSAPRDWGIGLWPSRGGLVEGNVVADVRANRNNGWAINAEVSTDRDGNIRGDSGFDDHYTQLGDDAGPTVIRGNRVHAWPSNPDHGPTIREHRLHRNVTIGDNLVTDQPFGLSVEGFAASVGQPATLDGYVEYIAANPRVRIPEALAWLRAADSGPVATVPTPVRVVPAAPQAGAVTLTDYRWTAKMAGQPLLIRLHGNGGGRERQDVTVTDSQGRSLSALVSPQPDHVQLWCADPEPHTWWYGDADTRDPWMERLVVELGRAVEEAAGTQGRYIHGISMGGGGAVRVALRAHAMGWGLDGVRADVPALLHSAHHDHAPGVRGVDRVGDVSPETLQEIRENPAAFKRLFVAYGTEDKDVSLASIVELLGVADQAGVPLTIHRGEGEGHRAGQDVRFNTAYDAAWRGLFTR